MAMTQEQHDELIRKAQATKQAIEEVRRQTAQRKLEVRRRIEDMQMCKELGVKFE